MFTCDMLCRITPLHSEFEQYGLPPESIKDPPIESSRLLGNGARHVYHQLNTKGGFVEYIRMYFYFTEITL